MPNEKGLTEDINAKTTRQEAGPSFGAAHPSVELKTSPVGGVQPEISFSRFFSDPDENPLDQVDYVKAKSQIKDTSGQTVFEMDSVEVPESWSQLARDILISKYIRKAGVPKTGHEVSARQTVTRIAKTIARYGVKHGYFDQESGENFEAELAFLLIHQHAAFNSPVWFNLGLYHEYGIEGSGGNYRWDEEKNATAITANAYSAPQCSACFIQSLDDDLMSIFQLLKNEARLFKYGSGTGTNFSSLRGVNEKLAGGGTSSGLMSFLEVFDKGAGATKSGGTTRRAAKMVCLDMDHPEIEEFISWKAREELKVKALIDAGYSSDFNGEAYKTVAGQNSNNSVRVTDEFMQAVAEGKDWSTRNRTDGSVGKTLKAKDLWHKVGEAAWKCADPGVQFDTTINDWHTCPNTDRIYASNPCSEYMFLNDSACNLSSINLVRFLQADGTFDVEGYRRACRTMIMAQEILVDLSSYPTERIAQNSHDYRPLGLGYANLGTLLMLKGIPYDSDQGRAWAGALTSIMCGHAYAVSSKVASVKGAFAGFEKNEKPMLRVIKKHREHAMKIDQSLLPKELADVTYEDWDLALRLGKKHGYRNSQVTVLAPTGTIGLLMDCDTTGVEPDFALVKFKKLAGGGYFKIVNQSVPAALRNLGYKTQQIDEIVEYVLGTMSFDEAPHVNRAFLEENGLTKSEIDGLEEALPATFELSSVFTRHSIGDEALKRMGVPAEDYESFTFDLLRWLGLSDEQIEEANEVICGTMTVEGAPHLKEEHLPVFDCANKCGKKGERFIRPMGHVRMMAAVQPFLSGAISKTVNLPSETTVDEIKDLYHQSWKLGLKAVAVYRDGCKLSQPLAARSEKKKEPERENEIEEVKEAPAPAPQIFQAPVRMKLPHRRQGFTQEASVGGHKVYIRTGEYDSGQLGEIFLDMHKEGASYRSMMNCFAISVSLGLQYGVPLQEFVNKFTFTRFEPSGIVEGHPNVKMATSILDFVFRVLGMEYLGRTDFLQVKPAPVADLSAEKGAVEKLFPKEPARQIAAGVALPGQNPQMEMVIDRSRAVRVGEAETPTTNLADLMGDAPPCDSCGHTTVRNGACYRCLNCGNSMGCS